MRMEGVEKRKKERERWNERMRVFPRRWDRK